MEISTARLDGFLSGVSSVNGRLRDYSAAAYLIESDTDIDSIKISLRKFYEPQARLEFPSEDTLDDGLQGLEKEIRDFLVRDETRFTKEETLDLQSYLSFRVMELVGEVIIDKELIRVLKMSVDFSTSNSKCIIFCAQMPTLTLVLQFNNDIDFKIQQRLMDGA